MSFYLDTSVLVPLFVIEEHSPAANSWLKADERALFFSHLVFGEFTAALSRMVRIGQFSTSVATELRTSARRWLEKAATRVDQAERDLEKAAETVGQPFPKLLMPDAIHLATCKRLELTIVTFDEDLFAIAAREGVDAICPAS